MFKLIITVVLIILPSFIHSLTMLYHQRQPYLVTHAEGVTGLVGKPITEAAAIANLPLFWKIMPAKRQLVVIEHNEEAVCAAGWFKNEQREQFARYTLPIYQDEPIEILARRQNARLTTARSLKSLMTDLNIVLLVKNGYSYGGQIDGAIKNYQPKLVKTTKESTRMIKMIDSGAADYMFMSPEEFDSAVNAAGFSTKEFKMIKVIDILPGNKRYIICSKKVSENIINTINKAIEKLKINNMKK